MVDNMFNKELADVVFDVEALDEWKKTAKELGMDGQLGLASGEASPIPYPFLNDGMYNVYNTLCPNKTEFKNYKNTTIPLEVLKQIAFSVKENHFQSISIWADDKQPDPIVIGETNNWFSYDSNGRRTETYNTKKELIKGQGDNLEKGYNTPDKFQSTDFKRYIIARWGDELRDFAELKELAIVRIIDNVGGELERAIASKTEKLNLVKENAKSYMNGNISLYEMEG